MSLNISAQSLGQDGFKGSRVEAPSFLGLEFGASASACKLKTGLRRGSEVYGRMVLSLKSAEVSSSSQQAGFVVKAFTVIHVRPALREAPSWSRTDLKTKLCEKRDHQK